VSVDCLIHLEYGDKSTAEIVLRSIEQDNASYAEAWREGDIIVLKASAKNESSMLHTLEDLLSCVKVAGEMVKRSR
jgi:tRNA threonylcarbamoyladenosine modification (KEOPS) complex  Pcc1 subunit